MKLNKCIYFHGNSQFFYFFWDSILTIRNFIDHHSIYRMKKLIFVAIELLEQK